MSKNFIITGAPGTGKTSIIEGLRHKGVHCFGEVAREVIIKETVANSDALPFKDVMAFTKKVVERMKVHLEYCEQFDLNVFDRGLPDSAGYLMVDEIEIPQYLIDEISNSNYEKDVFITPFWKEIYTTDSERLESIEHAKKISNNLYKVYKNFGYNLIEIPKGSINERVEFVYSKITSALISA